MRSFARSALAAALLICTALAAAVPARAQFTLAVPPRARIEAGGGGASRSTSVIVYPVAPFVFSGPAGVRTLAGGLLSVEHAVVPDARRPTAYAFGGWYWTDFVRDLYELHAKYYFRGDLGAQLGIIGSTQTGGLSYDAFLIYNLTPANTDRNYWNFQAGAGLFVDPNVRNLADPFSKKTTVTDFTGFLQGDTTLRQNLKLSVSYWYVGAGGRFNRVAVGLGWTL